MSADFDHTYYTDSDEYRAFSQAIFLELWPKGLFYRGERPTFWCPVCETPLAEADIDYEERPSNLVWMKFPLTSGGEIRIATTRPELLVACRAAIVHPEDARFAGLQGKKARVPLYGREVPILAHSTAKPEFGSGAAMICSYGDMGDLQLFRELRLDPVKSNDEHGKMTDAAGPLKGLEVEAGRGRIPRRPRNARSAARRSSSASSASSTPGWTPACRTSSSRGTARTRTSSPRTSPCRSGRKAARSSGRGSTTRCSSPGSSGGRSRSIGPSSTGSASMPAVARCIAPRGT